MSAFHDVQFVRRVYIAATSIGLAMGFLGYGIQLWGEPLLPFLGAVLLNALHIFLPRPSIVLDQSFHPLVRIAAFLCGISGFIAAGLFWLAAANRSISDIWNQFIRKGHVLVMGDGAFAKTFANEVAADAGNVLHALEDTETLPVRHRIRLDLSNKNLERRAGLLRSETLIVDLGSDAENLSKVLNLLGQLKSKGAAKSLATRVTDPVLSDQFFEILGPIGTDLTVSVFDENLILARHVLEKNPLYKRAKSRGQARVHAVIIGFDDLGEKILDLVFLTSVAAGLDRPRVTVLDPNAETLKRAFCARRPRVMTNLDINFMTFDPETHPCEGTVACAEVEALRKLEAEVPATMIYIAKTDDAAVTRTAIILRRMQQLSDFLRAPVSYTTSMAEGSATLLDTGPVRTDAAEGFIRMALPAEKLTSAILGLAEADRLANRIHEAYRTSQIPSSAANVPWAKLADTFKRSNRRTSDHASAKFWSVGVRLASDEPLSTVDRAKLEALKAAPDTDETILKLAELEHERWRTDRFLDGWKQGKTRDDVRRIHTTLVPFEELMPEEVEKDITQVRELIDIVLEK